MPMPISASLGKLRLTFCTVEFQGSRGLTHDGAGARAANGNDGMVKYGKRGRFHDQINLIKVRTITVSTHSSPAITPST